MSHSRLSKDNKATETENTVFAKERGKPLTHKATTKMPSSHSSECKSSVESAPSAVMKQTSRTIEEVIRQEISAVVAVVSGRIVLPTTMTTVFERNGSDASLLLTC